MSRTELSHHCVVISSISNATNAMWRTNDTILKLQWFIKHIALHYLEPTLRVHAACVRCNVTTRQTVIYLKVSLQVFYKNQRTDMIENK